MKEVDANLRDMDKAARVGRLLLLPSAAIMTSLACGASFTGANASDESVGGAGGSGAGETASPTDGVGGVRPEAGADNSAVAANGGAPPEGQAGSGAHAGAPAEDRLYFDAVLADEPLAYWRMGVVTNRRVFDETGSGNDLILQGGGHTLDVAGAIAGDQDAAIDFDGASSFALASDARRFDFAAGAPFTLECWARRSKGGVSYFQTLLSSLQGVSGNRNGYMLYLLPEPSGQDNARSAFEYDQLMNEVGLFGALPDEGAWAHYVSVYSAGTARLYVNGSLEATAPVEGAILVRSSNFTVARASDSNQFYFKGGIDEVAIYGRALGAADVARHYSLAQ